MDMQIIDKWGCYKLWALQRCCMRSAFARTHPKQFCLSPAPRIDEGATRLVRPMLQKRHPNLLPLKHWTGVEIPRMQLVGRVLPACVWPAFRSDMLEGMLNAGWLLTPASCLRSGAVTAGGPLNRGAVR
jgi:hypothetical protein